VSIPPRPEDSSLMVKAESELRLLAHRERVGKTAMLIKLGTRRFEQFPNVLVPFVLLA
jgi:hypothetical protein